METQFASDSINVEDMIFYFDGNSKITCNEGTFNDPKPNSFSLVQVLDCPGSTEICRAVCYVHGLQDNEPLLHIKYVLNSINLRRILEEPRLRTLTRDAFVDWINENINNQFRWHVSGDIISEEHADFIGHICERCEDINFWIYTRSFEFIHSIVGVNNLVVNLSVDNDNISSALHMVNEYGLRMCYMTVDGSINTYLPKGSVIFPSYNLRGRDAPDPTTHPWWQSLSPEYRKMVCPPDFFGQSEKLRCGPCKKCLTPNVGEDDEVLY